MVSPWKWLLLLGHFILSGYGRASCQGIAGSGRAAGDSTFSVLRQLWPPARPGLAQGSDALLRRRLSHTTLTAAALGSPGGFGKERVAYQDLLALLSVAFEGQQQVIEKQRSRMDQLLAEFADIKQELEQDDELQELYAELRKKREKAANKKNKLKKRSEKESLDASTRDPVEKSSGAQAGTRKKKKRKKQPMDPKASEL
eukprot:gb/GFBE01073904.1/.p1 GENE.gb/GFBE01073904.1/~~gb/GFBE01073904.1/.p1  ORF type:complete len:200 (+),score=52.16 gb/GFBE01073904.1/:1-600(+)